jgi:hypothetical protein
MPYPTDREVSLEEIVIERLSDGKEFRMALEQDKELDEFIGEVVALASNPLGSDQGNARDVWSYINRIFMKYVDREVELQRDDDAAHDDTSFG